MNHDSGGILKKVLGIVIGAILTLFILVAITGAFYTIGEQQQGVVTTFGEPTSVVTSGLHFKIPFVQKVTKVDTTIRGFNVGYTSGDGQYNSKEDAAETDTADGQTNTSSTSESLMITSDYNFIDVDFYVEYRVTDPVKALYNSQDPQLILNNIAQNCIRSTIGSYTVDSVLTTGKNEIQANIQKMIIDKLEKYDLGIQLVDITIQDAIPPTTEVNNAFKAVETAKQGKETAINEANKYRNEKIPEASAQADKVLQDAEAQKQQRINEATGQVARFNSEYAEYIKYPEVTKRRMFYEAMEDVLPDMKVIIEKSDGSTQNLLPIDSFNSSSDTSGSSGDKSGDAADSSNQ